MIGFVYSYLWKENINKRDMYINLFVTSSKFLLDPRGGGITEISIFLLPAKKRAWNALNIPGLTLCHLMGNHIGATRSRGWIRWTGMHAWFTSCFNFHVCYELWFAILYILSSLGLRTHPLPQTNHIDSSGLSEENAMLVES